MKFYKLIKNFLLAVFYLTAHSLISQQNWSSGFNNIGGCEMNCINDIDQHFYNGCIEGIFAMQGVPSIYGEDCNNVQGTFNYPEPFGKGCLNLVNLFESDDIDPPYGRYSGIVIEFDKKENMSYDISFDVFYDYLHATQSLQSFVEIGFSNDLQNENGIFANGTTSEILNLVFNENDSWQNISSNFDFEIDALQQSFTQIYLRHKNTTNSPINPSIPAAGPKMLFIDNLEISCNNFFVTLEVTNIETIAFDNNGTCEKKIGISMERIDCSLDAEFIFGTVDVFNEAGLLHESIPFNGKYVEIPYYNFDFSIEINIDEDQIPGGEIIEFLSSGTTSFTQQFSANQANLVIESGNQTEISTNEFIQGNVIVETGAELLLTGSLSMNEDAYILVERGARLWVHGGLITSCGDDWRGIMVEGNGINQPDNPLAFLNANDAGVVVVDLLGTIENASSAIFARGMNGSDKSKYGGLVFCDNARFYDNDRAVEFYPFSNDKSQFINTTMQNGRYGISLWNNHGVEIIDCNIINMSEDGVYSEEGTISIFDNTLFLGNNYGVYIDNSIIPVTNINRIGLESGSGNLFQHNYIDMHFVGADHANDIYHNSCSNSTVGIYMNGKNTFSIKRNTFTDIDRQANNLQSTGNGTSAIHENVYTNTVYGIILSHNNEDKDFDINCFYETEKVDVLLNEANIDDEIGLMQRSASNCFSHDGALDVWAQNMEVSFIYWEPPLGEGDECQRANDLNPIFKALSNAATPIICMEPSGPPNDDDGNLCVFDTESMNMDSLIQTIEIEIASIEQDSTNTSQPGLQLSRLKKCLNVALKEYVDSLLTAGDCTKAFLLYDRQTDNKLRIKALSVLLECDDCSGAQMWLNSFIPVREEIQDYTAIQSINSRRLCDRSNFVASQNELDLIYTIAHKTHPYAAYARSLWHIITEESIFLPDPELVHDTKTREKDETFNVQIQPNPVQDQLNLLFSTKLKQSIVQIVTMQGHVIARQNLLDTDECKIDLIDIPAGIYIVKVTSGGEIFHLEKFTKL